MRGEVNYYFLLAVDEDKAIVAGATVLTDFFGVGYELVVAGVEFERQVFFDSLAPLALIGITVFANEHPLADDFCTTFELIVEGDLVALPAIPSLEFGNGVCLLEGEG
jgi:hypothetical protein